MFRIRHYMAICPSAFAGAGVMGNRPTVDQNQADQHLWVARAAIAAVAIRAHRWRSLAFETGRGEIVEYDINLQREQIAQPQIQRPLDLRLALKQLVEGPIPLLELAQFDLHPRCATGLTFALVAPLRHPSPAMPVADEVGLQPPRQPMFAAGCGEAIGYQD